ncbi:hypothetical protein F5Y17DRAFT_95634 [Xylariaceae sp. FL0594]|nr:hypothetical protein F5Y17DRAFT_95634 [Xylariaceae sp. FL0594]
MDNANCDRTLCRIVFAHVMRRRWLLFRRIGWQKSSLWSHQSVHSLVGSATEKKKKRELRPPSRICNKQAPLSRVYRNETGCMSMGEKKKNPPPPHLSIRGLHVCIKYCMSSVSSARSSSHQVGERPRGLSRRSYRSLSSTHSKTEKISKNQFRGGGRIVHSSGGSVVRRHFHDMAGSTVSMSTVEPASSDGRAHLISNCSVAFGSRYRSSARSTDDRSVFAFLHRWKLSAPGGFARPAWRHEVETV